MLGVGVRVNEHTWIDTTGPLKERFFCACYLCPKPFDTTGEHVLPNKATVSTAEF